MERSNENKVRILIVDTDAPARVALSRALTLIGYQVEEADSCSGALKLLENKPCDLVIVELQLEGGIELMQQVRERWPHLLIIVLTSNPTLETAVSALRAEAVDYLTKPAKMRSVVDAIMRALQKRTIRVQEEYLVETVGKALDMFEKTKGSLAALPVSVLNGNSNIVFSPPLKLNRAEQSVTFVEKHNKKVELTKGETAVLAGLMLNSDHTISCQQLVRYIWGYDIDPEGAKSIIRPYISRLRKKIGVTPKKNGLIHTIRGEGYLFKSAGSG